MATLTVTSNADSGTGSLRAAIALAQPGDKIRFDPSLAHQTITLTSGQLEIHQNLIIDGRQAPGLTISGNHQYRVIDVSGNTKLTLRNVIIAEGTTTGVGEEGAGAGIRTGSHSQLIIQNAIFKNNLANGDGGGAIFAGWRSTNRITNSRFEGNSSFGNGLSGPSERGGGAIAVKSESSLTVKNSQFRQNTGTNGGAINTLLSGLTVENSTFSQNTSSGYGGAIFTDGASATPNNQTSGQIKIKNSRIDSNTGAGQGGGLFLYVYESDQVLVDNSTIINNQVIKDARGDALGGGLRHGNGALIVHNTTFANNRALVQGGGLWVGEDSPVTIDNSTFYGNRAESIEGNSGLGGAITLSNGSYATTITQTTVANNYAGFMGAGIWGGSANTVLTDTLFADNLAHNGGHSWNINHHTATVFSDGGGNFQSLEPNPTDTKITAGVTLLDPKLGLFHDNGGAVQIPPLPGNSVVTAGAMPIGINHTAPTAPSDLIAKALSPTQIELTWADKSSNETGFQVERSQDQLHWTVLTTTTANITHYRDTDLAPNSAYYYRIRATNEQGDSTPLITHARTNPETSVQHNPVTLKNTPNQSFILDGDPGIAQLQFNLTQRHTQDVNEVGIFLLDDASGRVNGILPGEEGYLQTALSNAQVIFSALPSDRLPDLHPTRQLGLETGQVFGFYLVKDSTTDAVLSELAAGETPRNVVFGTTAANGDNLEYLQVDNQGSNRFKLAWEDDPSSHPTDFNDLELTVELTRNPQVLGTALQGRQEGELIDLRDHLTGVVSASFVVNHAASYHNTYGFYRVDDPTGRIGALQPGDPGYAKAAVSERIELDAGLPGGSLLAPFMIADGEPEQFLSENPKNQPGQGVLAYFVYLGANPDGQDHVRLLGDNVFGFEDNFGGRGDQDYNDLVVEARLG